MLLNVLAQICLSRTHNKSERYIVSIVAVRNGLNGIKVVRWSSTFITVEECRKCRKLVGRSKNLGSVSRQLIGGGPWERP